jgi:hypothetical protein
MKTKNEKRGKGRPKERLKEKVDFEIVQRYAALGFTTNEELAYLLDVSVRTIIRYKKNPEFLSSIQKAIFQADAKVVQALHKRATGFNGPDGKYYAPDTIACNSWLNNRRRHQWAWSPKSTSGLDDNQTEQLRKLSERAMDENL